MQQNSGVTHLLSALCCSIRSCLCLKSLLSRSRAVFLFPRPDLPPTIHKLSPTALNSPHLAHPTSSQLQVVISNMELFLFCLMLAALAAACPPLFNAFAFRGNATHTTQDLVRKLFDSQPQTGWSEIVTLLCNNILPSFCSPESAIFSARLTVSNTATTSSVSLLTTAPKGELLTIAKL